LELVDVVHAERISLWQFSRKYRETGCPRFGFLPGSWGFRMPSGLKRHYGKGDLHFVTFSCYQRLPLLGTKRARNVFVHELEKVRNEMGFQLIGYVVMPEHVHLLMSEPLKGTPSTVLQKLKLAGGAENAQAERS